MTRSSRYFMDMVDEKLKPEKNEKQEKKDKVMFVLVVATLACA